jgi:signal transduction histidine kinase
MLQNAGIMSSRDCAHLIGADDVSVGIDPVVWRMAHDLRNIFQIISGNLALLSRQADDPSVSQTYLDRAIAGVDLGTRLVGTLQSGNSATDDPDPLDLMTAAADIEALLADAVGPNINLRVEAPKSLREVAVDLAELESALLNVAINARDAMDGSGVLTVVFHNVCDIRGSAIEITMTDSGYGMSPNVLERAFEPFFSTKGRGGSGLGLATVDRFVRRNGGSIRVASVVGRGTTIRIRLPAAAAWDFLEDERREKRDAVSRIPVVADVSRESSDV